MEPERAKRRINNYISSWKEFLEQAMQIITEKPHRSRYVIKYQPVKEVFILKVTDGNKVVLKRCPNKEVTDILSSMRSYRR